MNELLPRPLKLMEETGVCIPGNEWKFWLIKDKDIQPQWCPLTNFCLKDLQSGNKDEIINQASRREWKFYYGKNDRKNNMARETENEFKKNEDDLKNHKIIRQAYSLKITEEGIAIFSKSLEGLCYALSTVSQLFEINNSIPCATIFDRPILAYRGFLQDMSRGQVLSLEGLKRLVQVLSTFRYNFLTFNIEHTFSFESHPEIGTGNDPLTKEELKEFIKHAGIEIIPSQQSLGHMRGILSLPRYRHLAYDENLCWSIDPSKEDSYRLIRDLYDEIIPCYESEFFNVCCDEPFDLKKNFDESRFRGRSFARVYFDHLMRLKEILDYHGKRVMVWGDMLLSHPEIIEWLPKDVIVLNWQYGSGLKEGPEYYREKIKPIADAGLEFMTCTCTWNLTKIFTNLEMAETNNSNFIKEGIKAGSIGNILTNWGDMGHMNLLGLQAYPVAYAAQFMWSGEPLEPAEFDKAFSFAFFNDDTGRTAALMRKLQEANNILGHPVFGDMAFQLFFDETLAGDFMLSCRGKDGMAGELEKTINEAQELLDELLSSEIIRKEWLEDIRFPLRQLGIIAEKARIFLEGKDKIQSPEGAEDISNAFLNLAGMTKDAAKTLEQRWLAQAKRSDLEFNLDRFSRLCEVYNKRSGQFKDLAARLKNGEPVPEWREITHAPEFITHKFDIIKEMGLKDLI